MSFSSDSSGGSRENHVLAGSIRLHYITWGRPDATPIIFLHAGGLSAHSWDAVSAQLHKKYFCLALDLRGHGDSEWALDVDYSLEAYASDLAAFIRTLPFSNFALVGVSLGALVALQFVGEGGTPDALIIVDSGPEVTNTETRRTVHSLNLMPDDFGSIDDYVAFALGANPRRNPEKIRRSHSHNIRRLSSGRWVWKFDRRYFADVDLTAFEERRSRLWKAVEAVRCPTLVVRGANSNLFTHDQATGLARRLPRGRLAVAEGARHSVESHDPVALSSLIDEFLTEVLQ